jgi:hypothetical protein
VIGFIQHPANRVTIRRAQFRNEIGDLGDHGVHAVILVESDSGATFVYQAFNR